MEVLYAVAGAALVVAGWAAVKLVQNLFTKIFSKISPIVKSSESVDMFYKDILELKREIRRLDAEVKDLRDFSHETQSNFETLNPHNFTNEDGKTVFIKDGKESKYETIDWRNR